MFRKNYPFLSFKSRFIVFLLAVIAFLSCFVLPQQYVKWLLPSASAKVKSERGKKGGDDPSAVMASRAFPGSTLAVADNDIPPTITSPLPLSLVNIDVDNVYNHTFTATGSPSPTFAVTAGTLPPGLTLSPTGILSGRIFRGSLYENITVTASNGIGSPATQTFSIRANNTPYGTSDTYGTAVNTPLTINAPGVLINDTDANNDPITAVLGSHPAHGSVVMNSNGSFTYTPETNFRGGDGFYYRISDGYSTSSQLQVDIVVLSGGTLEFSTGGAYSVSEGAGDIEVQIPRSDGSFGTTTVDYATSDGTARAGSDYTPVKGTVTFADRQLVASFRIPILNDSVKEANETINLTISNVTGTGTLGTQRTAVLTINDDDTPTLQFSKISYDISEGAGSANITIARTGDSSIPVTVKYATSDPNGLLNCNNFNGIASSRCDYATTMGTLQFIAGENTKTISIPIVDDSYSEGPERFLIGISDPSSEAVLGFQDLAIVTIQDNEATAGSNPILGVPFFVRQQYIDFLGREPDAAGFAGWQNILNNCPAGDTSCDRIAVSSGFFRSPEFQDRGSFIFRFYSASLGRNPSYAEFMPDLAKVSGFLSAAQLEANKLAFVQEFMTRTEFVNRYGSLSNTAFVDTLVQTSGLTSHPLRGAWIDVLNNGTATRAEVLRAFTESKEVYDKSYNTAFVVMQYFGYLRRDPDASYLTWIQILNTNGGDYRGMISGFMNSTEYVLRFGP